MPTIPNPLQHAMPLGKACSKCGQWKPYSDFYRESRVKDGHTARCIACILEIGAYYKSIDPDRIAQRERSRVRRETAEERAEARYRAKRDRLVESGYLSAARALYRQRHPERVSEQDKRRQRAHPEKAAAHNAVNNAIKAGRLERQPCRRCGNPSAQAHHHLGYAPEHRLDVEWLCARCHGKEHRKHRG